MNWKLYVRILSIMLILYSLYIGGVPTHVILLLGVFFVLLMSLRGTFYRKIDAFLVSRFSFVASLPSWGQKLLITTIFILIYVGFKQILFFSLKTMGLDLQQILMESLTPPLTK
ncbi:hypothetical protein BMS3Abin16_01042 [archaeon BMS3Abin16]|nr:hypothetical protein BMS3Abin16_01042 [archaeon BMS3Abin16]